MASKIEVIEDPHDDEYYGPMTYIRVRGVGEHIQDDHGLILHLCGFYPQHVIDKIVKVFEDE